MDFNKSFDVEQLKLLLEKLQYYDVKSQCWDWIEDYVFLKNISQRIVINGECAEGASHLECHKVMYCDQSSSCLHQ